MSIIVQCSPGQACIRREERGRALELAAPLPPPMVVIPGGFQMVAADFWCFWVVAGDSWRLLGWLWVTPATPISFSTISSSN
jgi:hypothetical protein